MQKIGVFVCHCGTNIAATVDVKAVAEALSHEPGVVISQDYQYMCSESGQELVKNAIKELLYAPARRECMKIHSEKRQLPQDLTHIL